MLPLKDSNLNKQDQNLSYYRYTKRQYRKVEDGCVDIYFYDWLYFDLISPLAYIPTFL